VLASKGDSYGDRLRQLAGAAATKPAQAMPSSIHGVARQHGWRRAEVLA
jgi:hypothetical protein